MPKISAKATTMKVSLSSHKMIAGLLGALLAGCLILAGACGELRPVPASFEPQGYKPIDYQDLLDPSRAGLKTGDLVRVKAYFWQYLDYDPAMVRNYLTLLRYPIRWYQLQWFSTYGTADLTGYFDLAAVTPEQADRYKLKRLDQVILYGELARLGAGLFLQVFQIEPIAED
jgi:hypothetical protein